MPHFVPQFGLFRIGGMPGLEFALPCCILKFFCLNLGIADIADFLRNLEGFMLPSQVGAGGGNLFSAQRRTVGTGRSLEFGAAESDLGGGDDQGGLAGFSLGCGNGSRDLGVVMTVDLLHMPAGGNKAALNILGPGQVGLAFDGDAVAVVDVDQITQLEVACQSSSLVADPLLQAAVAHQGIDRMVDRLEISGIETLGSHLGGDGHADAVGKTLPQRPGGNLNADGVAEFGMAGGLAAPLTEVLQLVQRQVIAEQVQQRVEQHRAMAGREDETVAVGPAWIIRVEGEIITPQGKGAVGRSHGKTGVTGVGLLNGIGGEETDGIGAKPGLRLLE